MEDKIIDYISGVEVKAGPEEVEAVQVFSRQLVEDYGYPKEFIQTRPQYRVKVRPSDTRREYPVDIAVFNSEIKDEDHIYIIVECKKKNRKDGKNQLENYLIFSKAQLGVWFNGEERAFIRKIEKDGKVFFEDIPNIPNFGQKLEDIGKFKRKDLKVTHNLKANFKAIRNYLAANNVGATRDEVLAQQLINIIFCKIYDEKYTGPEEEINFRAGTTDSPEEVKNRIDKIFENVKREYRDVIDEEDKIDLEAESIQYIVGELQNYCLMEAERDVIADAFEVFIGHALKGGQGQFFTPRNVIKMMVDCLNPKETEVIIDPACGSGGFLLESLRYIWRSLDTKAKELNWNSSVLTQEKLNVAYNAIRGIDKDYFLSKVAKAYMAIIGDGKSGIFCEDSLEDPKNWKTKTQQKIGMGVFDIVLTNPPFGSKIPVKGEQKLKQYELAYKWKLDNETEKFEKGKIKDKEVPQILFIERCIQLLRDGGRMAIVLPDGIYGNESLAYIRNWIIDKVRILAIIDIPLETFLPNTGTKTSIMIVQKDSEAHKENYPIFMAIANSCGHDRRGNEIPQDDIQNIAPEFRKWCSENNIDF